MNAAEFKTILYKVLENRGQIQEIRIRAGQPILLRIDSREWYLHSESGLQLAEGAGQSVSSKQPVCADSILIRDILEQVSRYSLYVYEEEIRQGFLSIEGGHRIGLAGKVVPEGNGIRTLKEISALNIRVAHECLGCADEIMEILYENGKLHNTLFLSPPGAGKTTMLRDVIRQVSNGNRYGSGQSVAVVDERSELAACVRGIPQCELGIRTDVMDACPKVHGMRMMLRSMAPGVIAVDEIGTREDIEALRDMMKCGCRILATVHGDSVEELRQKPVLSELIESRVFSRYVVLSADPHPGTLQGIYEGSLRLLHHAAKNHLKATGS